MSRNRRQHNATLVAKVAVEALADIEPAHAIAARHGMHAGTGNGEFSQSKADSIAKPGDIGFAADMAGLMTVDCEGFKEFVLSPENFAALRGRDFIVETHDGFVPGIARRLIERFQSTHHVEVVEAVHDFDKGDRIRIPLLDGLPRREAEKVLAEGREHARLRWPVCKPSGVR